MMLLTPVTTNIFVALAKHSALPNAAGASSGAGGQP